MKKGPSGLTLAQESKIENWYIKPYIEIIQDSLADIKGIESDVVLKKLISLIAQDKKTYRNETLNLPIGDGVAQKDVSLFNSVKALVPTASTNEIQPIYDALYKLFHEIRLNKSPDSPFADDHNAAIVAKYTVHGVYNADKAYNEAYQKTGNLATRLLADGPETSSETIEAYVLASLRTSFNLIVEIKSNESPKHAVSSLEAELDFMTEEEIAEYFRIVDEPMQGYLPQYGAKKHKSTPSVDNLDYQLALSLQQEEQSKVANKSTPKPAAAQAPSLLKSLFGW